MLAVALRLRTVLHFVVAPFDTRLTTQIEDCDKRDWKYEFRNDKN